MGGCFLCAPHWGPAQQPRHVPWLGIKQVTLCFTSWCSIQWATPARAQNYFPLWETSQIHSSLFYNILFPIPPFLNFSQLSLLSIQLLFFCNLDPDGLIPFQFYFRTHSILFHFLAMLFLSPVCIYLYFKFCSLPSFARVLYQHLSILFPLITQHFPSFIHLIFPLS